MRRASRPAILVLAAVAWVMASPIAVAQKIMTAAAVWHPAADFLTDFHAQCDGLSGGAFDACFAAAMAKAGASQAALDFTRNLGDQGYLRALDQTGGPIAIAHAVFPFRANENDAWLLVNGTPPLIDVDDRQHLPLPPPRASAAYAEIRRRYPNVGLWPGDRGASQPEVSQNGREIIVGYLLRDLCHACAIVGRVRYEFDFAADGNFSERGWCR